MAAPVVARLCQVVLETGMHEGRRVTIRNKIHLVLDDFGEYVVVGHCPDDPDRDRPCDWLWSAPTPAEQV